ncbi:MAG: SusC/RagA family TonB-linked outer membrane protein [Bacteroidales bacterium]|nr:SusC/RagA family TonB-linked outer membrane protein [Bacteroidales bacterium]MCF8389890.1 SusC/RagA family TonB-linked outer membrane protein [Bacteroidales bacterium]
MKAFKIVILLSLISSIIFAQNQEVGLNETISGTVSNLSLKTPMGGVEITIISSDEKHYTEEDGSFTIPFNGNDIWILISYPGYTEQTHLISNAGSYHYFLSETKEKSVYSKAGSLFGNNILYKNASYSDLSQENLKYSAQVSPELAIQGKFAGLQVKTISGMPGEGAAVNIRGISSLFASQNPMVILDGVPINSMPFENQAVGGSFHNPLVGIDVNDIESIEMYKDGLSLYGVDGGTGIMAINTKRPESVTTKVDFSIYKGLSYAPEYISMMSASQHKSYLINQLNSTGMSLPEIQQANPWITGNPSYYYFYNFDNNTNWQDEVFNAAYVNKYNATLQGGDEIARFFVSLGYLDQEGVTKNTAYQRFNFRFNSDVRILEKLYMISNVGFSYHTSELQSSQINPSINPVLAALSKGPMYAPYLRDNLGNQISILSNVDAYGFSNPTAIVEKIEATSFESNLIANTKLVYEISRNLNLSTLINVTANNIKEGLFVPNYGIQDFNEGEIQNYADEGVNKLSGIFNETKASFTKLIGLSHYISGDAGFRFRTDKVQYNSGTVYNTPTDEFKSLSSVTSVENTMLAGDNRVINHSDIFMNSGYRFKDKYLLDVILNLSASSSTGNNADAISIAGGKWGFFPTLQAGWLLSNEAFLKSVSVLNLLKLRASYSRSGNDFYSSFAKYSYNSRSYGTNSGIVRTYLPNQELKWEDISQLNVGLDLVSLGERIFLSVDAYNRVTNDLLTYSELPVSSGFEYLWENNGSLTSKGLDISAQAKILNGELKLAVGGNIGFNNTSIEIDHDIILDIPGGQVIARSGSNALSFYGFTTNGIIGSAAEASALNLMNSEGVYYQAGDVHFVNQNTDSNIDDLDKMDLGDLFPNFTGGINLDFSYRRLSLSVLFDFQKGNKIFNYTRMVSEALSGYGNQTRAALYAWTNENDITDIPRIALNDPSGNAAFSDRWIEDGSIFRLKELSVAYTLPSTKMYKNLIIYLTGQNLFTVTDYLGYYPEFAYSANPVNQGSDYGQMPVTPMVVMGIKVGF